MEKLISGDEIIFFKPYIETPASVGIDNKKEILAASTLLKFKILAAVIVIPDLLTPGIKDKIWKKPINKADFNVKSLSKFFFNLNLSQKCKIIPKINVVHAIILIFLISSIILVCTSKNPNNKTGVDEIKILKKSSLFKKKLAISFLK